MLSKTELLSGLNLFTLVVVAAVLMAYLLFYLRKKGNRRPMADKREENVAQRIDETQGPADPM